MVSDGSPLYLKEYLGFIDMDRYICKQTLLPISRGRLRLAGYNQPPIFSLRFTRETAGRNNLRKFAFAVPLENRVSNVFVRSNSD